MSPSSDSISSRSSDFSPAHACDAASLVRLPSLSRSKNGSSTTPSSAMSHSRLVKKSGNEPSSFPVVRASPGRPLWPTCGHLYGSTAAPFVCSPKPAVRPAK